MIVRIEKGSTVPISRQILEQIRAQCLSGSLPPGTRLPSVRELARELVVNQNTILRVYQRLMADKLVEMRHGEGTFVAAQLPLHRLSNQQDKFAHEFAQLVRRGRMLGLSRRQLRQMLDQTIKAPQSRRSKLGGRQ